MLAKLRVLLEAIQRHEQWLNEYPNGLQIANERPCMWSRATTYRWLDKARKMGIVDRYDYGSEYKWFLTTSGQTFLRSWHELPF